MDKLWAWINTRNNLVKELRHEQEFGPRRSLGSARTPQVSYIKFSVVKSSIVQELI